MNPQCVAPWGPDAKRTLPGTNMYNLGMSPTSASSKYVKPKRINLKNHPQLNERWVQDRISEDPSIIGLGPLKVVSKERQYPGGGKLDLLLADQDGEEFGMERYAVEVQLGGTDPSHIIRTIEYWDLERTRNPGHDIYAVLVAEDVTGRFLNVVSLLNKTVPLLAIQMQALEVGDHLTLVFTTVVDLSPRQLTAEDVGPPVDRNYWEKKSRLCLEIADEYFDFSQTLDSAFERRYNQDYISIAKDGNNLLGFRPLRGKVRLKIMTRQSDDFDSAIQQSGLALDYRYKGYRFQLDKESNAQQGEAIKVLIKLAFATDNW